MHRIVVLIWAALGLWAQPGNVAVVSSDNKHLVDSGANISNVCLTGSSCGGTTPGFNGNQIISGCGLESLPTSLNITIGPCVYSIAGVTYTISTNTNLTFPTPDMTNPRLDLVIACGNGSTSPCTTVPSVVIDPGTAAMVPIAPIADTSTTMVLWGGIQIPANATAPANIGVTLLYDEGTGAGGGEWTATCSTHFNCTSTSNPYLHTHDIEATAAVLGDNFTLIKPASGTVDISTANAALCYVRSKAAWPTGNNGANAARNVSFWWQNGSTQVGNRVLLKDGVFGFSSSTVNAYQQVSIPTSLFGTGTNLLTTLKGQITGNNGTSSIGFYIDDCTLQGGAASVMLPATLTNFRLNWNSTTAYNPNDIVIYNGTGYVALKANTNVLPTDTSTWVALATAAAGQRIFNLFGPAFVAQTNTENQVTPTGTFTASIMLVATGDSLGQYANTTIAIF